MRICNVLSTLKIGSDTAVVVDGSREFFSNGVGVLDEKGRPYVVLSVGMDSGTNVVEDDKASLLIEGRFVSKRLFI